MAKAFRLWPIPWHYAQCFSLSSKYVIKDCHFNTTIQFYAMGHIKSRPELFFDWWGIISKLLNSRDLACSKLCQFNFKTSYTWLQIWYIIFCSCRLQKPLSTCASIRWTLGKIWLPKGKRPKGLVRCKLPKFHRSVFSIRQELGAGEICTYEKSTLLSF